MKKLTIVATLLLVTGVLASKTEVKSSKTIAQPIITKSTLSTGCKELASGD